MYQDKYENKKGDNHNLGESKTNTRTENTTEINKSAIGSFGNCFQEALFFENRTEREWLSTKEAAHFLRLSENALRIMVHREQVRVFRFGRRLRFRLTDCQALFTRKGA